MSYCQTCWWRRIVRRISFLAPEFFEVYLLLITMITLPKIHKWPEKKRLITFIRIIILMTYPKGAVACCSNNGSCYKCSMASMNMFLRPSPSLQLKYILSQGSMLHEVQSGSNS
ncbi:Mediator of RNA polymerase II transcription subunit [Musa troglodytarum]|uniref:Mediator of RNA polymerase II transcription subunit n=1 Tax=Musa troglodytarum TaxID=320322 RepID=A0A9E7KKS5_9LILI|nr:Mediator of RNA polymerase II transcription subunit [Musa troglodytarum]